ncbi:MULTISPECIES: WD40/YVTN/BNR-like repeat-containing protein [unclassified Paenibacillus]|uniref:WD40/YVTN/BNR-like repeat-containing protein n=1 Tax=unclassified Paenibacillus TaxID=185978 RepID=UPI0036352F5A
MRYLRITQLALLSTIVLLITAGCDDKPAAGGAAVKPEPTAPAISQPAPGTDPAAKPSDGTGSVPSSKPQDPSQGNPANSDQTKSKAAATAVAFVSATEGWAGGNGFISHTTDGGQHWDKQYSGTGNIALFSFLSDKPKVGWAYEGEMNGPGAGSPAGSPKKSNLLHTVDGGASWTVINPSAALGKEIHFISEQEGFSGNKTTQDGGKTWKELPVPAEISGEAYFNSSSVGWAVVNNGDKFQIEHTKDGGKTWQSVYSQPVGSILNGAVIRSTNKDDVWIQLIGDSGMTQTSYSLLHSKDGGNKWIPVVANSTAGGGPAPGYQSGSENVPKGPGNSPGQLLPLSPQAAFMLGYCRACGDAGEVSVGWTLDAGTNWTNGSQKLPGQDAVASFVDDKQGWLLTYAYSKPSVLYKTTDGGKQWSKLYSFGS